MSSGRKAVTFRLKRGPAGSVFGPKCENHETLIQ